MTELHTLKTVGIFVENFTKKRPQKLYFDES